MKVYAYECRKCGWYREVPMPPSSAVAALVRQRPPACTNPDTRCNTAMNRAWTAPALSSKATPTRRGGR